MYLRERERERERETIIQKRKPILVKLSIILKIEYKNVTLDLSIVRTII